MNNTDDTKLLNKALHGTVMALCMLGRKEEARGYALRLENETERDDALCWCLDGDEKIRHCPHGRPVMFTMTKYNIDHQFKRT